MKERTWSLLQKIIGLPERLRQQVLGADTAGPPGDGKALGSP
jgi:hypothetical protein